MNSRTVAFFLRELACDNQYRPLLDLHVRDIDMTALHIVAHDMGYDIPLDDLRRGLRAFQRLMHNPLEEGVRDLLG